MLTCSLNSVYLRSLPPGTFILSSPSSPHPHTHTHTHNSQPVHHLLQFNLSDLSCHGLHHLPPNGSTLRGLCVRGLLDLIGLALCEPDTEHT